MSARELLDAFVRLDEMEREAREVLERARRRLDQLAANRADLHARYRRLTKAGEGEG